MDDDIFLAISRDSTSSRRLRVSWKRVCYICRGKSRLTRLDNVENSINFISTMLTKRFFFFFFLGKLRLDEILSLIKLTIVTSTFWKCTFVRKLNLLGETICAILSRRVKIIYSRQIPFKNVAKIKSRTHLRMQKISQKQNFQKIRRTTFDIRNVSN